MKLYNTLSREIQEIDPINPPSIGIYACGPTVYDYTHIGHLRKYVMDDVLVRTLQQANFKVKHVMNITDVGHLTSDDDDGEDKLEKGAKKHNLSVWDLAEKFEKFFWDSLEKVNVQRPQVVEKVTDCIQEQIDLVKDLEKKGFTYEIPGDGIYFDTSKLDDYGKLAKLDIENLKAGARVEIEGKKNITDFALWKYEREGENRQMFWESPWSKRGFPGWHIECSVIALKNLTDAYKNGQFYAEHSRSIDIHTGGIDHIPVHHTNEIAQSEAATGKKPFVKYWVHHNFLRVDNEKMSKSLNNFYTIDDILKKGFSPQALRLLFLTAHYRSELNFTWEALSAAQKAWERSLKKYQELRFKVTQDEYWEDWKDKLPQTSQSDYIRFFIDGVRNDLNTPKAMAVVWDVLGNALMDNKDKYLLLRSFDKVLGLGLEEEAKKEKEEMAIPENISKMLIEREEARASKDWQKSDELRSKVQELGFSIEDTGEEQKVTKA